MSKLSASITSPFVHLPLASGVHHRQAMAVVGALATDVGATLAVLVLAVVLAIR